MPKITERAKTSGRGTLIPQASNSATITTQTMLFTMINLLIVEVAVIITAPFFAKIIPAANPNRVHVKFEDSNINGQIREKDI